MESKSETEKIVSKHMYMTDCCLLHVSANTQKDKTRYPLLSVFLNNEWKFKMIHHWKWNIVEPHRKKNNFLLNSHLNLRYLPKRNENISTGIVELELVHEY